MSGVPKIEIKESVSELKSLMSKQKSSLGFAKVQTLYLWKIRAVETVRHLAILIGKGERTIHRWLRLYRQGGIEKLLEEHQPTGRPKKISVEQAARIQSELRDPEGFKSYKEVHFWLEMIQGISSSYLTVYRLVKYELLGSLKVARPKSKAQLPGEIEEWKATLTQKLKGIIRPKISSIKKYSQVSFWCSDEMLILQVDNAPAHIAEEIDIPDNVILFVQPPYCPEVNPIERLWEYLKEFLAWECFESLDHLRTKVDNLLNSLSQDVIASLTGWSSLLQSLSLSGL
jgi:transposase